MVWRDLFLFYLSSVYLFSSPYPPLESKFSIYSLPLYIHFPSLFLCFRPVLFSLPVCRSPSLSLSTSRALSPLFCTLLSPLPISASICQRGANTGPKFPQRTHIEPIYGSHLMLMEMLAGNSPLPCLSFYSRRYQHEYMGSFHALTTTANHVQHDINYYTCIHTSRNNTQATE